jgi:hypothetical protein
MAVELLDSLHVGWVAVVSSMQLLVLVKIGHHKGHVTGRRTVYRYVTDLTLTHARYIVCVCSVVHSCYMLWCYCHTMYRELTPNVS